MSADRPNEAVTYLVYNDLARAALQTVLESKSIALMDLIWRLKKSQVSFDPEQAKNELRTLKEMQLVEATSSGVEDFDTYYATASGLEAGRLVGI